VSRAPAVFNAMKPAAGAAPCHQQRPASIFSADGERSPAAIDHRRRRAGKPPLNQLRMSPTITIRPHRHRQGNPDITGYAQDLDRHLGAPEILREAVEV
jgi:hypothetical protein